jgi:hypothetical protein
MVTIHSVLSIDSDAFMFMIIFFFLSNADFLQSLLAGFDCLNSSRDDRHFERVRTNEGVTVPMLRPPRLESGAAALWVEPLGQSGGSCYRSTVRSSATELPTAPL